MFLPCEIPEGQSGPWRVERFTVSDFDAAISRIQLMGSLSRQLPVPPGQYVRLVRSGVVWMSDTPSEMEDNRPPVRQARRVGGHCLVTGLGLGLVTEALLSVPEVTRVTVVEIDPDVVALVGPTLRARWGDRLDIVQADALTWRPPRGVRYSVVWHDIWPYIMDSNQESMTALKRHYGRRADWQQCWREATVRRINKQERKSRTTLRWNFG